MSDLHCPARIVLARHGEAAFAEAWFSDEGGSLTPTGRAQAAALADAMTTERVATILCSDVSRAVQTAEIVAARTGRPVTARKDLREAFIGDLLGQEFDVERIHAVRDRWYAGELDARFPGGESGHDVLARHLAALEELADSHRGETALVVGHQTALGLVLHVLLGGSPAETELDNAAHVALEHDGDGWRRTS